MVRIMTLLPTFEARDAGKVTFKDIAVNPLILWGRTLWSFVANLPTFVAHNQLHRGQTQPCEY